jgi:hypothetical protein
MIQNMSTFVCTNCGHHHDIFGLEGMLRILWFMDAELILLQVLDESVMSLASNCLVTSRFIRGYVRTPMQESPLL